MNIWESYLWKAFDCVKILLLIFIFFLYGSYGPIWAYCQYWHCIHLLLCMYLCMYVCMSSTIHPDLECLITPILNLRSWTHFMASFCFFLTISDCDDDWPWLMMWCCCCCCVMSSSLNHSHSVFTETQKLTEICLISQKKAN